MTPPDLTELLRRRTVARAAGDRDTDRALRTAVGALVHEARLTAWVIPADADDDLRRQIVDGEQVHEITSPAALDRRLAPDRRIVALSHVDAPDLLLVFVEVALVHGLAGDMAALLDGPVDAGAGTRADTAIFYSINTCSEGLAGLGLGTVLLQRALPLLGDDVVGLEVFSTLSPIPGLRRWLTEHHPDLASVDGADPNHRAELEQRTAQYLVTRRSDGGVVDPVGNFHLGNGAEVTRVCWDADRSEAGRQRSLGVMVNYRYDPASLEERATSYRSDPPPVSAAVASLLRS